jgi:hypothetical protein
LENDFSEDVEGRVEFLADDGTNPFNLLTHKVKHPCTAFDDAKARKSIRLQKGKKCEMSVTMGRLIIMQVAHRKLLARLPDD